MSTFIFYPSHLNKTESNVYKKKMERFPVSPRVCMYIITVIIIIIIIAGSISLSGDFHGRRSWMLELRCMKSFPIVDIISRVISCQNSFRDAVRSSLSNLYPTISSFVVFSPIHLRVSNAKHRLVYTHCVANNVADLSGESFVQQQRAAANFTSVSFNGEERTDQQVLMTIRFFIF